MSLLVIIFFMLLMGRLSSKKPESVVSNLIAMKFDGIVLQVNAHRLTKSDF